MRGASGGAIYDLNSGSIYALNKAATLLAESAVTDGASADDSFIASLVEDGVLTRGEVTDVDRVPEPRLDYLWLELTSSCNLRCRHCYGSFGSAKPEHDRMTVSDWLRVISNAYGAGCREMQLIGGEPLCFPDFARVLRFAHDTGMERIDVFSNATLVTPNIAELLAETGATFRFSLYGGDAATHDNITGIAGSFNMLTSALRLLQSQKVRVSPAVVLMGENETALDGIADFLASLDIAYAGYDTVRAVSGALRCASPLSDAKILYPRYNTAANFTCSYDEFCRNISWNSCTFGKAAITARGELIPCIFDRDSIAGNVLTDSREQLSTALLRLWSVTKDDVDGCADCEYRYACHDCRPLAKAICGSYTGKYPRCCYIPTQERWAEITEICRELKPQDTRREIC